MNSTTLPQRITLPSDAPAAARTVFRLLGHLRQGSLDVQLPDGSSAHFGGNEGPRAALRIRDWAVCSAALRSGDIGFAESFVATVRRVGLEPFKLSANRVRRSLAAEPG